MKQISDIFRSGRFPLIRVLLAGSALVFATAAWAAAGGDTNATEAPVREPYVISLFATDRVLRDPNEGVASSFELFPGSRIEGNAELNLRYSWSPLTLPDLSAITIFVNDTPVDSRILKAPQVQESEWTVEIPGRYFRTGDNEVRISVVHRTIGGPCRDIDNDANWFIVRPETRLGFVLSRGAYGMSDFPRPFSDPWSASKTNTVIYLPPDCDDALSTAIDTAAFLGRSGEAGALPGRLEIRTGKPEPSGANQIVFVKNDSRRPNLKGTDSADVPVLTFQTLSDGHSRLSIAANDSTAFSKALAALKNPQLVKTFVGDRVALSSPFPAEAESGAGVFRAGDKTIFTLSDLGYADDIPVTGAFHQEAYVDIPRPTNYRTGEGSYIEFHFRHSPILHPQKSAVTVYIDDIPVRAAPLLRQNADGGVLDVPIPASELNKPWWAVRFAFYHDLGVVDCSKRYDEVAWSVVEKNTALHLKPGPLPYLPTWDCFPGDFPPGADGRVDLTLLLKDGSEASLNPAAMLAWYVGNANGSDIRWHVRRSAAFDAKTARGTILAVGNRDDPSIWKPLESALPVYPVGGGYRIAPDLNLVPETLKNFDICEIGHLGDAKAGRWVYAFLLAPDSRLLTARPLGDLRLGGRVSLTDANGLVSVLQRSAAEGNASTLADENLSKSWAARLYDDVRNAPKSAAAVYLCVLGAVILLTFVVTIVTWKKR